MDLYALGFDLIALIILLACAVYYASRGFLAGVFGFLGTLAILVLAWLLSRYVDTQLFRAVLESIASEQGARMTAMTSATKNAGEMIDRLTLSLNRARQAAITTEIAEIVGTAEALK